MSYEQKLERSGCTQVSELSGCDINMSKAENAAAGFGAAPAAASASPYTGTVSYTHLTLPTKRIV